MDDDLQANVIPSPEAVESAVGDETIILHLKTGTYFGLDPMGTRIWAMLKDGVVPAAICRHLAEEFEVEPEVVEADARRFLAELKANDIIVDA